MRPVALLTDFGLEDHYTGVLHAVLAAAAPGAERIDISHAVPPGDIWTGCYFLRCAWPYLPDDAVVLAVVDPGVGSARRAVAAAIGGRWIVAPDNGLATALGRPESCVELDPGRMGIERVSPVFHGRDLFAPAAARLARGDDLSGLGPAVEPAALTACPLPEPRREGRTVHGVVLHVDRFGNLVTNVPWEWCSEGAELRSGWRRVRRCVRTYADGPRGEAVLLGGSSGLLEVAINGASASAFLDLGRGDPVTLRLPAGESGGSEPPAAGSG